MGRSERTHLLAGDLELLPDLDAVVRAADLVVSSCPPDRAGAVLDAVLKAAGRTGTTPVSSMPTPCRPPPWRDSTGMASAPAWWGPSRPEPGQASGVKMCTASVYEGTTALWLQALQTGRALGGIDVVLADLAASEPGRARTPGRSIALAASKSGRLVAEMKQIAQAQGAAGASPELFRGMAAVFDRVALTELARSSPEAAQAMDDLDTVLALLAQTTDERT